MAQNAREWGTAICSALGFDPKTVTRVELRLDAQGAAAITVTVFPNKSEAVVALLREAGKHVNRITVHDHLALRQWDSVGDLPGGAPDEVSA